jgi:hypothetical protein
MTEQPTARVPTAAQIDQAIAVHDSYVDCVAAAVKHPNAPSAAVLTAIEVAGLDVDKQALLVMALVTARYVWETAADLGQHPALLWRRFATAESQTLRNATRPALPCDDDEGDTQP